jgi:hypothetical protein
LKNSDDEIRFVLDQHAQLNFYSASSLKQQSVDRHVAALGHIILIRANKSLLFLVNAGCLAEKQQIPILNICFTMPSNTTFATVQSPIDGRYSLLIL